MTLRAWDSLLKDPDGRSQKNFLAQITGYLFGHLELLPPVGPVNGRSVFCCSFGF